MSQMRLQDRIGALLRGRLGTVLKWLFAAAVLGFGIAYIAERWNEVSEAILSANPWLLIAALLATAVGLVFGLLSWRAIWSVFHVSVPLKQAARMFFVSQLGKYLPGSVWPIAAQAQMAREAGLSGASSIVLSLISMLISIATGLAFGAILTPFVDPRLLVGYWWLALVGLVLLCLLVPRVLSFGAHLALRVLRRPDTPFHVSARADLASALLQAVNWSFGGLQLWLIVVALGGDPLGSLVPALAALPLAFSLGTVLIPFPAGLGVREFVITLLLSGIVSPSVAVTAAVVSRIAYALCDFGLAGAGLAIGGRVRLDRKADA